VNRILEANIPEDVHKPGPSSSLKDVEQWIEAKYTEERFKAQGAIASPPTSPKFKNSAKKLLAVDLYTPISRSFSSTPTIPAEPPSISPKRGRRASTCPEGYMKELMESNRRFEEENGEEDKDEENRKDTDEDRYPKEEMLDWEELKRHLKEDRKRMVAEAKSKKKEKKKSEKKRSHKRSTSIGTIIPIIARKDEKDPASTSFEDLWDALGKNCGSASEDLKKRQEEERNRMLAEAKQRKKERERKKREDEEIYKNKKKEQEQKWLELEKEWGPLDEIRKQQKEERKRMLAEGRRKKKEKKKKYRGSHTFKDLLEALQQDGTVPKEAGKSNGLAWEDDEEEELADERDDKVVTEEDSVKKQKEAKEYLKKVFEEKYNQMSHGNYGSSSYPPVEIEKD